MSITAVSYAGGGQSATSSECVELTEMGVKRVCRRYRPQIRMLMILSILVTATIMIFNLYSASSSHDTELEQLLEKGTGMQAWKSRNPRPQRKGHNKKLVFEDVEDEVAIQMCSNPRLSLQNDANKLAFHPMPKLNCTGQNIAYLDKGMIRINQTTLGNQKLERCEYHPVIWMSDVTHDYGEPIIVEKEPFEAQDNYDFMHVKCWLHFDEDNDSAPRRRLLQLDNPVARQRSAAEQNGTGGKQEWRGHMVDDNDENAAYVDAGSDHFSRAMFSDYDGYGGQWAPDYEQFLIQIVPELEVLKRGKNTELPKSATGMNVLMLALDSMSHLSYQRKLPLTYKYLKEKMQATILNGYNIVGDATTAAIIPILTGKAETQLPDTRRNKQESTYVDVYPFIWNKFEQMGYATTFLEDAPQMDTFNKRLNGFEEMPTDHYVHAFWQAVEASSLYSDNDKFCCGPTPLQKFTLAYLEEFFTKYAKIPRFAFCFINQFTHDDNNAGEYIDEDIRDMLARLHAGGYFDNTLVIVGSDHGARYNSMRQTLQGKLEERLPMMSLSFPQWFKKKYRQLIQNLETNAYRLTTPFDLHETLRDVINMDRTSIPVKYSDRGISLLRDMPLNRTCKSAAIEPHWCTCMHGKEMAITEPNIEHAARLIVDKINQKTDPFRKLCHKLKLKSIDDARMLLPNEKVLKYTKSLDADQRIANFSENIKLDLVYYQVTIQTLPSDAMYEGTVQLEVAANEFTVSPDISRINVYGDQPHCILDKSVELRKSELELPETRRNQQGTSYVDVYPLIWNKFEEKGYATLFAEDAPSLGTFNLRLNGFEQMPTDHYIRPFWQAVHESFLKSSSERYCLGPTSLQKFTLKYLEDFITKYDEIPRFGFGFISEFTHHDNNPADYIDEDIMRTLSRLHASGYFDNTLVIVMGDHGARYSRVRQTLQGKLEERLPMMSLTFPPWFSKKYPRLIQNLRANADHLTTPFDLHETLKDVMNINRTSIPVKYSDRGISLLREMPLNRTCESAGIAPHWCTCMHWKDMDIKEPNIQYAAKLIVDEINRQTGPARKLCHQLTLKSIDDARMILPNEKVLKYTKSLDADQRIANFSENVKLDLVYYQVMIQTLPSNAMYEGTVQHKLATNIFSVNSDISRINAYGDQPHCIMDSSVELRKYCFCRTNPTVKPTQAVPKRRKPKKKT